MLVILYNLIYDQKQSDFVPVRYTVFSLISIFIQRHDGLNKWWKIDVGYTL